MSEFSKGMQQAWSTTKRVFGATTVVIHDQEVDVVEHRMGASNSVQSGRPGRTDEIEGELRISREDWIRVGGTKGVKFTYGHLDVRVQNDPLATQHSETLTLLVKAA